MEGLGINPWLLLAQIVNFVVLVAILRAVAYKPIQKMLAERQERIRKALEEAEAAKKAQAEIEKQKAEVLAEARQEAGKIIAEAREQAKELKSQALQEAEQKAKQILDKAHQDALQERDRILSEMKGQIASLAIAAAQKIIGEALDEQRQQALVESFFSGIEDGRVAVLPEGEVGPAGVPVTVTSALPLSEEQQEVIRRDLMARLGGESEIRFQVDPQILGGLVVRVGDRVVDGSVVGQLERLHQSLA